MRGSANIKVDRTIEDVWRFISDLGNNSQWIGGISAMEPTSEGELAAGATFSGAYRFDGKSHALTYRLTEFNPPYRLCYRISGGPHPSLNEVELKSSGDSTKVKHLMELDLNQQNMGAVFVGLGPMVRLSIMFRLRKDLKKLKKNLEANYT